MSRAQFNLLPDVKIQFIKAERTKKTVISIAILVSGAAFAFFIIMLLMVDVVQKQQLSTADKKVQAASQQLQGIDNLSQALTVQNQLITLSDLHRDKHISSRIFDYLRQVTPINVTISKIEMDLSANTISLTGNANSQQAVNTFADTLKFTSFKIEGEDKSQSAFSAVIEDNFAISNNSVNYGLKATFDPKLFSNNLVDSSGKLNSPQLTVPTLTTTRSVLELSGNPLFKALVNVKPTAAAGAP